MMTLYGFGRLYWRAVQFNYHPACRSIHVTFSPFPYPFHSLQVFIVVEATSSNPFSYFHQQNHIFTLWPETDLQR